MTTTETTFVVEALRRGVEERDASTLLDLYAEDAELQIVDRSSPPSTPRILTGRSAIGAYLDEISSRDMTHELTRVVVTETSLAYVEQCRYPDGTRVLCMAVLDLAGGRIVRQVGVQAWDE
jgi:ketosteroid isomerase-like protein